MDFEDVIRLGDWAARRSLKLVARAAGELEELVPQESRSHLLRAQREVLLAAQAALEHRRRRDPKGQPGRVHKIALD